MTATFREYAVYRSRLLNQHDHRTRGSDYILCWLQQTLRGYNNPVIDVAIMLGRQLRKPVVVYHGLGAYYPYASDRLHTFILQASYALEHDLVHRGLHFVRYIERPNHSNPGLVYQLAERAAAVVVDDVSAFVGRWQAQRVAAKVNVSVVAVDGLRLVPEAALASRAKTTPQFRALMKMARDHWLDEPRNLVVSQSAYHGELPFISDDLSSADPAYLRSIIRACPVDHTLAAVGWCSGERARALAQLAWTVEFVIPTYAARRNNPADDYSVTRLSPYLHFGILSPGDITCAVMDADIDARHRWKFLDELLVWREYFHHRAVHATDPAAYAEIPAAARATLAAHRDDPRPDVYDHAALIRGETHDETWNAAQKQFVLDGWMHNNLRMYWGKRLIEWCRSPEDAWVTACYLNDRFSLDGRDPATYGNLQWCFGASRPAREVAIYGTVPRKSDRAMRRRPGVGEWLEQQANRDLPALAIPTELSINPQPQASGGSHSA